MIQPLYQQDLAYIHAAGFGGLARGAAPEIIRRLQSAAVPIRRVVDAGCGAGPLTAALVEAGFEVAGIDSSADLLAIARAAVPQARFLHGSLYEVDLPPCDTIVALGEPLTYHQPTADADSLLEGFFRKAAAALPAGGLLIFDIIELGELPLAGRHWASGEDWAVLAETREDPSAGALVRAIETFRRDGELYRRSHEIHHVRVFDTAALCRQLAGCGFSVETAQAYGAQPLPPRRRAFFCARAI
jgi:SAM-dependent methyltransferase